MANAIHKYDLLALFKRKFTNLLPYFFIEIASRCTRGDVMEIEGTNVAVKRSYVASGTTPNKPRPKKATLLQQRSSKRTLDFHSKSPSPKAPVTFNTRLKGHCQSPRQLKSLKKTRRSWLVNEDKALIQFVALHKDRQVSDIEWPAFNKDSQYWVDAAIYIQENARTTYRRNGTSLRQRVVVFLKGKYKTVDEAEEDYGITCDVYLGCEQLHPEEPGTLTDTPEKLSALIKHLSNSQLVQLFSELCKLIADKTRIVNTVIREFPAEITNDMIKSLFMNATPPEQGGILDKLYLQHAEKVYGIDSNPGNFCTLSMKAMKNLQSKGRPNLVSKWCKCLHGDNGEPLLDFGRMPFGLLQYVMEFFTCSHTSQLKQPSDYSMWLDTMEAEFGGKFKRLFRGPMWSGCPRFEFGKPQKARANIPCVSTQTQLKAISKSEFTTTAEIQIEVIKELKRCDPKGDYWIKADGTDVKEALQESMRKEWNGDVDMRDGKLEALRESYCNRLSTSDMIAKKSVARVDLVDALTVLGSDLNDDVRFLHEGLVQSIQAFRKKFDAPNTPVETLKSMNWEIVEFHTLLEQVTAFKELVQVITDALDPLKSMIEDLREALDTSGKKSSIAVVSSWDKEGYGQYLRNLYKKKRQCASHILVFMLSSERRNKKPYCIPVQYVPYHSIRDQEVKDLTKLIKVEMTKAGLSVVGTCTDGEFEQLRRRGATRPLHIWQLAHDARDSVSKMSKTTLLQMFQMQGLDANQRPIVARPNPVIPKNVIILLHQLRHGQGMSLEDGLTYLRGKLVPDGYAPYPFRKDTPESVLDKLRSLVATYQFRADVHFWKGSGVDFSVYCYCPEVDPDTGKVHHERADHNHVLKRIAKHTRDGGNQDLTYERFDEAMRDANTGLTYAALVGQRRQSVPDAEKLLSYHVAEFFRSKGYGPEAEYVETVAQWHEASDGRGITQLQRCRQNYKMLNFILDQWIPWHHQSYDLSSLDINRPISGIRGFSRETVIEVTTNIESQEYRRRQNHQIGYEEHPRAGSTDDLECFFSMCHSWLGPVFTLREFKHKWIKIVSEYTKRMDPNLPYYYHTINERFSADLLPSFDQAPAGGDNTTKNPYRLKRLKRNTREDGSIFSAGRSFLPARNAATVRQRFHRFDVGLPPVPQNLALPTPPVNNNNA